jgi:hypothetical protein
MDPTGGLRDIRSLNTAYAPIPRDPVCQDDDWNTQSNRGALPLPVMSQKVSYTKQKALHRSRLVFRIISLVASGTALGSFGDVVWSYMKTRDARSHHGSEKIWPDDIAHFSCVYMMISAAVITFVVDFGWFVASIKPEVRQLQGNKLKAICGAVEAVCLALMIAGVAFLEKAQGDKKEKWLGWVCEAKTLHSDEASTVDFPFLCGEVVNCPFPRIWHLILIRILGSCESRDVLDIGRPGCTGAYGYHRFLLPTRIFEVCFEKGVQDASAMGEISELIPSVEAIDVRWNWACFMFCFDIGVPELLVSGSRHFMFLLRSKFTKNIIRCIKTRNSFVLKKMIGEPVPWSRNSVPCEQISDRPRLGQSLGAQGLTLKT